MADKWANALRAAPRLGLQAALSAALLASNVGQRVSFKRLGYVLGPYPYFVLLSISLAFVLAFGAICAAIVTRTGGWLPETKTWHVLQSFLLIGACNALQGLGMVFANPHVPGYLQALLQQAVIPLTLAASALALSARYSRRQYVAVLVIIAGILLQLLPDMKGSEPGQGVPAGQEASLPWALVFLAAQAPVALAAVLQEHAFQAVTVNVFHMMFWASAAQFLTLLALAPLDALQSASGTAAPSGDLLGGLLAAQQPEALEGLLACVAAMLLSQLTQALVVKHFSAAYAVLCMALVLPASALAFTLPALMGHHAEQLGGTAPAALGTVFLGVLLYRAGESLGAPPESAPRTPEDGGMPRICSAGVGIIQSEYSAKRSSQVGLFQERTLAELAAGGAGPSEHTGGYAQLRG